MLRATCLAVCLFSCVYASTAPPGVVSKYDAESYAGTWYQIADYPQIYELACKACTTAHYALNTDGSITVDNTCRRVPTGGNVTINGKATVPDPAVPGKLAVSFFKFLPAAPYWIIALGPKNTGGLYSWAVVSNGMRESLYILSRAPTLTTAEKTAVFAAMAENQLSNATAKLKFTAQEGCWEGQGQEADKAFAAEVTTALQTGLSVQAQGQGQGHGQNTTEAGVGSWYPLHASCKMTYNFPSTSCADVASALSAAAAKMQGLDGCGTDPITNYCGYTVTKSTPSYWAGTHLTANGKYTDDLTFDLSSASAGCTAAAYSTSETWYAHLDNGVNYCNLHNLVDAALPGAYSETDVSDSTCTQYSSRNCSRY